MRGELDKYLRYILILLLLVFSYLILKSYLITLVTGLITAYISFPIYNFFTKKLKNKSLAATITILILTLIFLIPIVLIGNILISEATIIYQTTDITQIETLILEKINLNLDESTQQLINDGIKQAAQYLLTSTSTFLLTVPQKMANLLILFFVLFYSFKDGKGIVLRLKTAIPFSEKSKKVFIDKFKITINSLLYGEIVISILEWFIATLGFILIGVGSPALWGSLVGFVALFPAIGPAAIWIPLTAYYFLTGQTTTAIFLGLFGFFIMTFLLDTIVRAKILGLKGHIHPVIVLLGILGGLATFGVIGLLIGPLILVLLKLTFEIYLRNKHEA
ncbi:AI-2E family transporter [archaeon]|nr:AI-2E family transporter [archaeon]MBT5030359.1 AI-2E family transporter [archaeon]MBT5288348.1 AI-2E family transporter [archaeon]